MIARVEGLLPARGECHGTLHPRERMPAGRPILTGRGGSRDARPATFRRREIR